MIRERIPLSQLSGVYMKEINSVISGLSKNGFLSGLVGGALGGAVTGSVSRKYLKKSGGTVLKAGALAAVGGLAWKAYKTYSEKQSRQGMVANNRLVQEDFERVVDQRSGGQGPILILHAMIAAAYADGHLDAEERLKIFEQVHQMDLSPNDKAELFDAMENPKSMGQIVSEVNDSQTAIEVYTASVLAIDRSKPISAEYLRTLGTQLDIPPQLLSQIHHQAVV